MHERNHHPAASLNFDQAVAIEPAIARMIRDAAEDRSRDAAANWRSYEFHKRRLGRVVGHGAQDWALSASGTYECCVQKLAQAMRV